MSILHWAVLAPFIYTLLIPITYKLLKRVHTGWFVLPLPILLFVYFCSNIGTTSSLQAKIASIPWIPSLGIDFAVKLDGLGMLFSLLIAGIGSLVILYSIYYLDKDKEKLNQFYVYLLFFMGAMLGVVLCDNLIVLYMFWEITSISSFLLIGFWNNRSNSRYGAIKSMVITVFGGLSLLAGIVLLYLMTGSFNISEIITSVQQNSIISHPLFMLGMICILLGAFTKSAQFPFHIWLPDAMEAPTPVSSYLHSATMVKAGIYLIARLSPVFAVSGYWLWIVSLVGIITLLYGSFLAVKQVDLKGLLAYSTISQLGMIMSLLGIGAAGVHYDNESIYYIATAAAVFHLVNHATFKGSLFMMAGIVDHETGTRDIRRLGGLMKIMPITFAIALIGSLSMAGIPPLNGFLSKEMFFASMLNIRDFNMFHLDTWGVLLPIIAWVGSIFTFVYSMILVFKTFTGKYQPEKLSTKPHEAPMGMLISPIILVSLVVIFGLFPGVLSNTILSPAITSIYGGGVYDLHIYHWHGFQPELFMTIGVIVFGTILYLSVTKWSVIYQAIPVVWNRIYDWLFGETENTFNKLTNKYMTGSLRTYLIYIFSFFTLILFYTLFAKDGFKIDTSLLAPIGGYEAVLSLVLVISTIAILFSKSRLTSIILLGAVGYTVSLFYVVFRAPDLALTQLVIETVSVALFLLCFYHLPRNARKKESIPFKISNAVISVLVGLVVMLIAIASYSTKLFDSISPYYVDNTYIKAAGENMVNVILVDFRGFDTLFEITVLAIAAIGIYSMITLRMGGKKNENK
ncbi:Na+/H+ antiporter subunit A [Cytobacillus oceanisediminis]|uniref:Na+/H+ antiporter subunit A n=1 Tax=Bacillaceae TaxID=186817 RepID=UPI001CCB857A|nr:Na+/H+ antiporter subunit A [Cytobacillus oceanisediminis]MBQ6446866.1 Na+/H+ antiporter subunit A [Bacillus sp. (in: firmicutes)]MBZ9533980.1 Na+/H+ antiporter subunit A [Cytobacillus oceanisediminis]